MIHRLLKPHRLCSKPVHIILILLLVGFIYYTGLPTHILIGDSALNEASPRLKLLIDKKRYHPDHDPVWIQRYDVSSNETMDNFTKEDIGYNGSVPILTLFTTFDMNPDGSEKHLNTLRMWASLRPTIQPVLFSTPGNDEAFIQKAKNVGWLVYQAPTLQGGLPILRDMFLFLTEEMQLKSYFIGYSTPDIVFTDNLNMTLWHLAHARWYRIAGQGLLLSGLSHNVSTRVIKKLKSPIKYRSSAVRELIRHSRCRSISSFCLDYFITTANGFPFHNMPDFVVGESGYSSWIIKKSFEWRIRTIDATRSITALHQYDPSNSEDDVISKNACRKMEMIPPFLVGMDNERCFDYVTVRQGNKHIRLYPRDQVESSCDLESSHKIVPDDLRS